MGNPRSARVDKGLTTTRSSPHGAWLEYLQACQAPGGLNNAGRFLLRQFRESSGLSVEEFARRIDASQKSVYRWEQQHKPDKFEQPPPQHRLRAMAQLLQQLVPMEHGGEDDSGVFIFGHRLALRPLSYILGVQNDCDRFWVIKSVQPFLSGSNPAIRQEMIGRLKDNKHLNYCFVFFSHEQSAKQGSSTNHVDDQQLEARRSFIKFREVLERDSELQSLLPRVRGWAVTKKTDLSELGLGLSWGSTIIAEYNSDGAKRRGRARDMFVEVPVAILDRNPTGSSWFPLWAELAEDPVDKLWASFWQPKLNDFWKDRDYFEQGIPPTFRKHTS